MLDFILSNGDVHLKQTFIDGRNITESNFIYMQQELNFDEKGLSNYQVSVL